MSSDPGASGNIIEKLCELAFSRDTSPLVQFIKYAIVGGFATAVHIITFFLAGWFLFPCVAQDDIVVRLLRLKAPRIDESRRAANAVYSNCAAFLVSNTFCYILNRMFVFHPGRHSMAVEFVLFFAVSGIAIAIGTAVMRWLIARFRMQTSIAFGANMISSLLLNYVLRKFLIFNG